MPSPVGQDRGWFADGKLRYRRDGMAKVTGSKVFAVDIRARDLEGWPDEQSHAMTIHIPSADRIYEGLDLSVLEPDGLMPDVLIDAAKAQADGLTMPDPDFYGQFFLPPASCRRCWASPWPSASGTITNASAPPAR